MTWVGAAGTRENNWPSRTRRSSRVVPACPVVPRAQPWGRLLHAAVTHGSAIYTGRLPTATKQHSTPLWAPLVDQGMPRSEGVRRQGLEPRTRGLRACPDGVQEHPPRCIGAGQTRRVDIRGQHRPGPNQPQLQPKRHHGRPPARPRPRHPARTPESSLDATAPKTQRSTGQPSGWVMLPLSIEPLTAFRYPFRSIVRE